MTNQDSPIQDGSTEATVEQKIEGLIVQVRVDYRQGIAPDVAQMLQQRLIDAGIELDADRIAELVERVTAD